MRETVDLTRRRGVAEKDAEKAIMRVTETPDSSAEEAEDVFGSATRVGNGCERPRRSAGQIDPLQPSVGEEADRLAVRRPKGVRGAFSASHHPRL